MPHPAPAQPIVLYRHPLSGHCHRVELFLHLLGLPMALVDVDLLGGAQRKPEFLAMNSFGQVPVIDDNGTVVADSNAILSYLALRYATASWFPLEPSAAARVQRWLSAAAGPLSSGAASARWLTLVGSPRDTSDAVKGAHALFAVIEATLAYQGWAFIAAPEPCIADLALYTYTAHAPEGRIALDTYPQLQAWLARIEALPGFVPMQVSRVGLRA